MLTETPTLTLRERQNARHLRILVDCAINLASEQDESFQVWHFLQAVRITFEMPFAVVDSFRWQRWAYRLLSSRWWLEAYHGDGFRIVR